MPDILKIGMTERTPEIRLSEANSSDTWRPPTQYKIELAKKVFKPKEKETTLHKLLSLYSDRINPKREFFKIPLEEVKIFFELIDGETWMGKQREDEGNNEEESCEGSGEECIDDDKNEYAKSIIPYFNEQGVEMDNLQETLNQFLEQYYGQDKKLFAVQKCRWKKRMIKDPKELNGSDLTMYNLMIFASRRK